MNIYYSNPYSIEKNFGKAINDFCQLIQNEEDWIVIQDGDMTYLSSDWGTKIYNTLQANGSKFGLIGCYTNRLGVKTQLHGGTFSNNHNILDHIEIEKEYKSTEIVEVHTPIAGLFMAFQKKTWIRLKGFKESGYDFDSDFSARIRDCGMKLGLMKGLYVYHQYRPWSKVPNKDVKHLQ